MLGKAQEGSIRTCTHDWHWWVLFRSWCEQSWGPANPEVLSPSSTLQPACGINFVVPRLLLFTIPHISKDLYKPKRISLTELCSLDQIIFYFLLELAENWKISWLLRWAEMTKKWQTHQEGANPIWKSNIIFPIPHPRNISSSVQNNLGNVSNQNKTRFVSFLRSRCRGEGEERTYSNIKSTCIYYGDTCLTHQNV